MSRHSLLLYIMSVTQAGLAMESLAHNVAR